MGLLDGKVAVVTGSGRGVGREEALALAGEGAAVVVNDLGGEADGSGTTSMVADKVVEEIKNAGGKAAADYSDISALDGVDTMLWTALTKFGRLDIMVNNAGILRDKTMLNMSETDWDLVQKVHSRGTFLCARAAGRIMKSQGQGGVIINTTSVVGMTGNFGQANYAHAKGGIYTFTKTAAMELGRYGVRVHCVCPNALTRLTAGVLGTQNVTEEMLSPAAVAPLVVFLASDKAKDLNGRVIALHGGNIGSKAWEFKMTMSEGFVKQGSLMTVDEIADNIDSILSPEPDLDIMKVMTVS